MYLQSLLRSVCCKVAPGMHFASRMSPGMLLLIYDLLAASSAVILDLQEGAECKALGGGRGTCRSLAKCPQALNFKVDQPPICQFKGRTPIICCPRQAPAKQVLGSKIQAYCREQLTIMSPDCNPTTANNRSTREVSTEPSETTTGRTVWYAVYGGTASQPKTHRYMMQDAEGPIIKRTTTTELDLPEIRIVKGGTLAGPRQHSYMLVQQEDCQGINGERKKRDDVHITVFGGEESKPKTHKYMALVGHGDSLKDVDWSCGGSLISTEYVLSAAHCSNLASRGPARWARVGDLDISSSNEDAQTQDRRIVSIILHPNYKEPVVYNDIVLFKLDSPVQFTAWVFPICLHSEPQIRHEIATVTGWGRTGFVEGTSSKLLEADLKVYNDTECRRLMNQKDSKTPQGIDKRFMFCAGIPDGSKDACSGDSGGPLTVNIPGQCTKMQVGITSYGRQCGLPDSPGVYTRVSTYIDWIEKVAFANFVPAA